MNTSQIKTPMIPGPGSYDIPNGIKVQTFLSKQSTQKRFKPYASFVPGPGQYNGQPSYTTQGPKALILSRTKQHKNETIPGPGSYEPDYKKLVKSQPGYHLPKGQRDSFENTKNIKIPGPGAYDTAKSTLIHDKNNKITFGPQRKIKLADEKNVPGPGQYNTIDTITQQNVPKLVFGKAGRSQSYNTLVPGPGAYKTTDSFRPDKSKGFSISFKTNSIFEKKQKIPGPGAYQIQQIDKIKYKSSSFSMPKNVRVTIQNQKQLKSIPGPGDYQINTTAFDHKSFTLGKQFRKGLGQNNNIPGPGTYEIKHNDSQLPKFSIPKSNSSWLKPNITPGPANYEPHFNNFSPYNTQYQTISINKIQRKSCYDQKKNIPGPGQYTINELINKKGGFTVGHQKRPDLGNSRTKVPGPGQYDFPTYIKGAKKLTEQKKSPPKQQHK